MNPSEESFVHTIKERVHSRTYFRLAVMEGVYGFMGETPAEVLLLSIGEAALNNPALFVRELTQIFGQNGARSVTFYIDPNIAIADAANYARSLEKLFGPGAKLVLETVLVTLSQKTGVVKPGSKSFGDTVVEVKLTFEKHD